MTSRSHPLSMLLGVICALLLVACGSDDDEPRAAPTTTAPTTTLSQEQEDEEALRQLAEDWFDAVNAIYDEESDVALAEDYLVDPYLTAFRERVDEYLSGDEVIETSPRSSHEVRSVEVEGESAVVVECVIDADVVRDANGNVVNDEVIAQLFSTSAKRTTDGWRLSDRDTVSEAEGDQCASG